MQLSPQGKILVVDDDRLVLATLAHGLSQAGYEVIDADNGADAILLAREHRPDIALLDIRMRGMSGFDVAGYLRDSLQIPFIFLSAFVDDDTAERVRALGAVAYLVKPLNVAQILPVVSAALADRTVAGSAAAPSAGAAPVDPAAAGPILWIAVGILMERYSLARGSALKRLESLAAAEGGTPVDQALRLLEALEAGVAPS